MQNEIEENTNMAIFYTGESIRESIEEIVMLAEKDPLATKILAKLSDIDDQLLTMIDRMSARVEQAKE